MKSNIKINDFTFVIFLALLFPILPKYFSIGSFTIRILFTTIVVFMLIVFRKNATIKIHNLNIVLLSLLIWVIPTTFIQFFVHGEIINAYQQFFLWTISLFVLADSIRTKEHFLRYIDAVIFMSIIVCIFGIIEELFKINIFNFFNITNYSMNYNELRLGLLRIISFTSHAITYCVYCMFILILIFYRLSLPVTEKKSLYWFAYILVAINAILTVSRGPLLCLIFSQLLLLWKCGYSQFVKKILKIIISLIVLCVIGSFLSERFRSVLNLIWHIVSALFSEDSAAYLTQIGFGSNSNWVGERFRLYSWVWESVHENLLTGNGVATTFQYPYITPAGRSVIKESIEVEWLRTLFRYGFISMSGEFTFLITLLITAVKRSKKIQVDWEGKLNFAKVASICFAFYIICLFSVMQNEDVQIFYIFIILFIAYISNDGYIS